MTLLTPTGERRRSRSTHAVATVALVAIAVSSLATIDSASASPLPSTSLLTAGPATVEQSSPAVVVTTAAELRTAVNNGGVIDIAPGEYVIDRDLEIRRNGTQLRAVTPGTVTFRYPGSGNPVVKVFATGVVLDGLVVSGAREGNQGGGLRIEKGASAIVQRTWITGNLANQGAGIFNEGTLTLRDSTVSGNTAANEGGGLNNQGTATISNTTIEGNTALRGSAIASRSAVNVTHSTIVRNVSTSSPWSTLQRSSGTFDVSWSIIADNRRSNGSAAMTCSGTVNLRDTNLVSSTAGCTTVGTVLTGGPFVGPLQDNGGPTPTAAPFDGSPAVDAIAVDSAGRCVSGATADQRGTARPSGPGCDLGALEVANLEVAATLRVDTSAYEAQGLAPGVVEVGATSVPTNAIASQLAAETPTNTDGTVDTTQAASLRRISLRRIAEDGPTIEDLTAAGGDLKAISLRRINLDAISLRRIALRDASLRRIALDSTSLRRIGGLAAIPLSQIPLLDTSPLPFDDNGWTGLLAGTEFAELPLQAITLEQIAGIVPQELTLASIDLSSTSLRRISLPSALLSGVALGDLPLTGADGENSAAAWCAALFGTDACSPELVAEVADAELWEAQLAGADVEQQAVLEVPLSGLAATGLGGDLAAISLRRIALEDTSLRRISLRRIYIENTSLANTSLRRISLRRIDVDGDGVFETGIEDLFVGCGDSGLEGPCDPNGTLTLGDIARECTSNPSACKFREDADMGLLLDLLGVEVDGVSLLQGLSLFDIFLAFLPPEDVPWQSVALDGGLFQNIADPPQPTFHYETQVTIANGPGDVEIALSLPAGFLVAGGRNAEAATWCPTSAASCSTEVVAEPNANAPTYRIPGVASGTYELRVPVRAGLTIGEGFDAFATVVAVGPNGAPSVTTDPAAVSVVQDDASATVAPVLNDANLQLGYIGGSGELDVYSFTAPTGSTGGSARILLSNIPEGVDYDLTVYGPRPTSLRGTPDRELTGLGDVAFDLDPEDDVLPTDVVDDIAVDIADVAARVPGLGASPNYALRDISSRRSNNDEEVTIPALVAGTTYVVVVSGYFGDLSNEPYGLRIRLDRRTALPECAAAPFPYPMAAAPTAIVPVDLAVAEGINTLYVTNAARLDAESASLTSGVGTDEIITSIAATEGINGVDAGLLLLDALPQWNSWNTDGRCSPEARNALAIEIGKAIDAANSTAGGTIEHIVIVGGDGVVPMAAVPDLTVYSNESTFARDVLTNGKTNAVSGTIGSGFLLSDDPYATDRGISILDGDHELYVPDRAIGRLVETADEIKLQLDNFATFGGQLDPATFESSALATGYDFLTDGTEAIIGSLADAFENLAVRNDDDWNRDVFLGLYTSTSDYSVHSPNAHYDFESLLPAAADAAGDYTNDDLVTTSDFVALSAGVAPKAFAPVAALGFTVGCHAGLSVSDVQLGIPSLDWAQLSAQNGSQWVAHTTYGYGDTKIVAYSERLAALFARNVAEIVTSPATAPATLGAAVRDAKQSYLAGTLVMTPYDEKIMQSWTYYGLPMYTLGDDVPASPAADDATAPVTDDTATATADTATNDSVTDDTVTDNTATGETITDETATDETVTEEPLGLLRVTSGGPASFGSLPDGRRSVSIDVRDQLAQPVFSDPVDGSYYAVDGNTTQAPYRPVQPLVDVEIPEATSGAFGGFLITGLSSRDLGPDHVPFYARPIVDNSIDEERIVVADGAFPATLQQVTDLGDGQRLLVAAGQFQGGQRLFDRISGELLPRPAGSTDTDAPRFIAVDGTNIPDVGAGRGVRFDITTEDDATRVVIVFREQGRAGWTSLELSRRSVSGGNAVWFGTAPLISSDPAVQVEFFAQSVDAAGNVGLTSNKIENFLAVDDTADTGETAPVIAAGTDNVVDGRFFTTGATFTISPDTATFSIDGLDPFEYEERFVDGQPAPGITLSFVEGAPPTYSNGILVLDRGNHTIVAENDGLRVSRFFIVDPDAPDLQFSRDTLEWTNQPVDLFVTANDGAGSGVATLCLDGTCNGVDTDEDGVFQTPTLEISAEPGAAVARTIEATATDRLGNESVDTTIVRVDNAPPTIIVTPNDSTYRRGEVTVTIDVTDVGSGIADVVVNGSAVTVPEGSTSFQTTVPATVPADTAGTFTVDVTATDVAGNPATPVSAAIQIDNARPEVTLTPPDADWSATNIDVTVAATDVGSGVAQLCVDGLCSADATRPVVVAATDGTFVERTITASATDGVGNVSDTVSGTYKVDKAKPVVTVTPATTAWTNAPVVVTVTASDAGSGLESVCLDTGTGCTTELMLNDEGEATTTIDTDGITTIRATATDRVGNTTTSDPATVRIDTKAPTLDITPDDLEFRRGPVDVVVTASDALSGLASVCLDTGNGCEPITLDDNGEFRTTVDLADGEGARDISATAIDVAENKTTATATQLIDNVQPVVTLTPPEADWTTVAVPVTVTATDTGSGVAELCVDGICGPGTSRSLVVDTPPDSALERTVTATATDVVGNTATAIGIYRIDKAKPVVTVTPATTAWTNEPVDVTVAASDEGSGLQSVCLDTGDGCTDITLGADGTATTTIDTDGITSITATATDRVGNTTTTEPIEVKIDTKAPLVAITPDTPDWRNTDVTLTVTGLDLLSDVASISTRTCVDGTCSAPTVVDAATTTVAVTVPADTARVTTVEVVVTDAAGNETARTQTVRIDKVNPTATLSVSTDAAGTGIYNFGEEVTATFSCGDVGSGVATCELLDGTTVIATTSPATIDTTTAGTRTLTVRATDGAGNTFVTAPVSVTVGYRFCLNYNPNDARRAGSAVKISIRVCDAAGTTVRVSGLTLTALTVDGTADPGPGAPGNSNPEYTFTFDGVSSYEYTIKTTGLSAGFHDLFFTTIPVPNRSSLSLAELQALATNSVPFRLR
jgi:uncharacterized protein YjbI with pentapeptide repeats